MGRWVLSAVAGAASVLLSALSGHAEDAKTIKPCTLDPGPMRTVARVLNGETLTLDDGSVVRLIGRSRTPHARCGRCAGCLAPQI